MNKEKDGDYYLAINENASNESPTRKGKVQFLAYLSFLINMYFKFISFKEIL